MEPLLYYYDSINRNAIIVKPKKPFYNWLKGIYNDEEFTSLKEENTVYLIREMDSNQDILKWLSKNFDGIFVNELNDWYTDEAGWPQNRTFKKFNEWFDVEINSMVLDLEEFPVEKESIDDFDIDF